MPGRIAGNDRSLWIILEQRHEGSSLYPVGLEFRVNVSASCPCQWRVDSVWLRTLHFVNMEHLATVYYSNTTVKEIIGKLASGLIFV
jgi:hypothetical protein